MEVRLMLCDLLMTSDDSWRLLATPGSAAPEDCRSKYEDHCTLGKSSTSGHRDNHYLKLFLINKKYVYCVQKDKIQLCLRVRNKT